RQQGVERRDPPALAIHDVPRVPRLLVRVRHRDVLHRYRGVRPQRGQLRRGAMTAAISVQGVSKRFRLYHEHYGSLKERAIHFGRVPYEDFWALSENGLDFEIEQGTTVGLLGHNGSGKSTLLKCVAGIIQPTQGEIVTHGRLAALLELGAG